MPQLTVVAVTVGLVGAGGLAAPAGTGGPLTVASASAAVRTGPVDRAVAYVQSAQRKDGGFAMSTKTTRSDPVTSTWAILGLVAVGIHPQDQPRRGVTALTYLERHAAALQDTGDAARLLLILRAAGAADRKAGTEALARLVSRQQDDGGLSARPGGGSNVTATAFAVLALVGSRDDLAVRPVLDRATAWLLQAQSGDGWAPVRQGRADAATTGLVLQAIQAVDDTQYEATTSGQTFLAAHGNADGGLSDDRKGRSDVRATAWAMQGLYATGVDPRTYETVGGGTPGAYLTKQQQKNGGFGSILRTAQILPGLNGTAFPLKPVSTGNRRASKRATNPEAKTTHAGSGRGGAGALERAASGSNGSTPDAPAGSGSGTGTGASSPGSPAATATPAPAPAVAAAAPTTSTPPASSTSTPAPTADQKSEPTPPASTADGQVDGVVVGTQGAKPSAPGVAAAGGGNEDRRELLVLGAAALALFVLGSQLERRRPRRVLT